MPRDPSKGGPSDRERFQHMLNAAIELQGFAVGRERADLDTDAMFRRAVVNALQEIGEAAARITDDGRSRAPSLPWGQIVAARHVLVHVYWGIDPEQVWNALNEDIPVLIATLQPLLRDWTLPGQH